MPIIVISNAANNAIRSMATLPLYQIGRRLPNGDWEIPVSDAMHERLEQMRLDSETLSDTIIRAVAFYRTGGRTQ